MSDHLIRGGRAEILLVEDNDGDVELMRIGFERSTFAVNMHRARNGEECMAFLRREGEHVNAPAPDLILLDLNMPRMDGREVLAEIARDERLRHLPVVVLTTSSAESDILAAYMLRCSSYIVKPMDFHQFAAAVQAIANYWFTVVALPSPMQVPLSTR